MTVQVCQVVHAIIQALVGLVFLVVLSWLFFFQLFVFINELARTHTRQCCVLSLCVCVCVCVCVSNLSWYV